MIDDKFLNPEDRARKRIREVEELLNNMDFRYPITVDKIRELLNSAKIDIGYIDQGAWVRK